MFKFIRKTVRKAVTKTVEFVKGAFRHAEATAILTFSAIGLTSLIGEMPFVYALPMWIEAPMVIPVASVLAIILLLKSAEFRAQRRGLVVAA